MKDLKTHLLSCLLYTSVFFVGSVLAEVGLQCPACTNDCGPDGFNSCEYCACQKDVVFSCESITCVSGQVCMMLSSSAGCDPHSGNCIFLPQCVVAPKTTTIKNEVEEKSSHLDIFDMLGIDSPPTDANETDDMNGLGDFPFKFEPADNETESVNDCKKCSDELCLIATCFSNPTAKCTIESCTCFVSFLDKDGLSVNCFSSVDDPDFGSETTQQQVTTTSMTTKSIISDFTTAVVTTDTTGNKQTIIIIACVICAVCIVIAITVACKVHRSHGPKQKQESDEEKAEVLKPLSENINNNKQDGICSTSTDENSTP